jgi:hypothetical protein
MNAANTVPFGETRNVTYGIDIRIIQSLLLFARNGFIRDSYITANPLNLWTEGILPFEMRVDLLCGRFGPFANLRVLQRVKANTVAVPVVVVRLD